MMRREEIGYKITGTGEEEHVNREMCARIKSDVNPIIDPISARAISLPAQLALS